MPYVDGYVIPVRIEDRARFIEFARSLDPVFLEHGATRVVECWGDDVAHGHTTDFYRAVQAAEGETVLFSWIEWPDRAARDAGMARVMEDPRMQPGMDMPFDGRRMIFGGFDCVLDLRADDAPGR